MFVTYLTETLGSPEECLPSPQLMKRSVYFVPVSRLLNGSFKMSLPGHEGLQDGHALFGKIVLADRMLYGVEVTGNHQHRLHFVLTLRAHRQWKRGDKVKKQDAILK